MEGFPQAQLSRSFISDAMLWNFITVFSGTAIPIFLRDVNSSERATVILSRLPPKHDMVPDGEIRKRYLPTCLYTHGWAWSSTKLPAVLLGCVMAFFTRISSGFITHVLIISLRVSSLLTWILGLIDLSLDSKIWSLAFYSAVCDCQCVLT